MSPKCVTDDKMSINERFSADNCEKSEGLCVIFNASNFNNVRFILIRTQSKRNTKMSIPLLLFFILENLKNYLNKKL